MTAGINKARQELDGLTRQWRWKIQTEYILNEQSYLLTESRENYRRTPELCGTVIRGTGEVKKNEDDELHWMA